MNHSVLNTIKKMLGIDISYDYFDPEILTYINSVISILKQLGVRVKECGNLSDASAMWSDLFYDGDDLNALKSYIWARVRLMFDPPTNSSVIESLNSMIKEFEWRITVMVDESKVDEGENSK